MATKIYTGVDAQVLKDGIVLGSCRNVKLEVNSNIDPYYEIKSNKPVLLKEGMWEVRGSIGRFVSDTTLISLLTSTTPFDLIIKTIDENVYIKCKQCYLEKASWKIPAIGALTEDIDFFAIGEISIVPFGVKSNTVIETQSQSTFTILHNIHRKLFYYGGYYWCFYWDGYQWVWKVSPDEGESWYEKQLAWSVQPYGRCAGLDVKRYGTNVYTLAGGSGYQVNFRKGIISDYEINWNALKKIHDFPNYYVGGTVDRSTTGILWSCEEYYQSELIRYYNCFSNNEGVDWASLTQDSSDPISTTTGGTEVLPLLDGDMMGIFKTGTNAFGYFYYDGSWTRNYFGIQIANGWGGWSTASYQDKVFLAYLKSDNSLCFKYYNGSSWENEEVLVTGLSATSFPVLCLEENTSNLYVFWIDNDKIYVIVRSSGIWYDPVELIDSTASPVTANFYLTCFRTVQNDSIGLAYVTGSSPWTIRHVVITL